MKTTACFLGAMLALASGLAQAAPEAVERATSATGRVVQKTENAVKRGLSRAADAVETTAERTASGVQRGAKRLGLPTTESPTPQPTQGEQPRAPEGR